MEKKGERANMVGRAVNEQETSGVGGQKENSICVCEHHSAMFVKQEGKSFWAGISSLH